MKVLETMNNSNVDWYYTNNVVMIDNPENAPRSIRVIEFHVISLGLCFIKNINVKKTPFLQICRVCWHVGTIND